MIEIENNPEPSLDLTLVVDIASKTTKVYSFEQVSENITVFPDSGLVMLRNSEVMDYQEYLDDYLEQIREKITRSIIHTVMQNKQSK